MPVQTAYIPTDSIVSLSGQTNIKAAPGSLLDALHRRHTSRQFIDRPLSQRHLSQVLWSAYGINRADGKRTSPAAMGIYVLHLYVIMPDGIYEYIPQNDILMLVAEGDLRACAGQPDITAPAPVNIAVYADFAAFRTGDAEVDSVLSGHEIRMAALNAGAASENIYLYCASEDINVVERILFNDKAFRRAVPLPTDYNFMVALTLGYGE